MAKQLYDYWFVQFDFPDENGMPYKSNGGKMVWDEKLKREIPEGWESAPLKNLVDIEDSKRIPLSNAQRAERKGQYPYYGATGIMDYVNNYIFDYDIILLAEDGSTSNEQGHPIVQYVWGKVWVNNHAHILRPKKRSHLVHLFFLLNCIPAKLIETGSIQKKISQDNLLSYYICVPPLSLRERYTSIVYEVWEQVKNCKEEINSLIKQRDELLPLLMNGQVSVNYDLSAY